MKAFHEAFAVVSEPDPAVAPKPDCSAFSEAAVMLWAIQRRMTRGCGNHGCRIGKIEGMATNGPCRCTSKDFARELRDIAEMLSPNSMV